MTADGSTPGWGAGVTGDGQDTRSEFRYPLLALGLTTAVAGLVDAFTLLRYGVFTANQSGNIVHAGMGVSGRFPDWPAALASIVGFGAGGTLARRLRGARRRSPPVSNLVGVIMAVALWSVADLLLDSGHGDRAYRALLAGVAAVGIGILAMLFARTAGVKTTTTYQTSTVLNAAQGLSEWTRRTARRRRAALRWRLGLLGMGCYAAGGALGAVAQPSPVWVFAITVAALAVLLATVRPR